MNDENSQQSGVRYFVQWNITKRLKYDMNSSFLPLWTYSYI